MENNNNTNAESLYLALDTSKLTLRPVLALMVATSEDKKRILPIETCQKLSKAYECIVDAAEEVMEAIPRKQG